MPRARMLPRMQRAGETRAARALACALGALVAAWLGGCSLAVQFDRDRIVDGGPDGGPPPDGGDVDGGPSDGPVADAPATDAPVPAEDGQLSEREREVAALVLEGLTYKQIGERLFISAKTVEHHVARMRQPLGSGSRGDLFAQLRSILGS